MDNKQITQPTAQMSNTPVTSKKILMLHGHAQSGSIFNSKTGALRKCLVKQMGYELLYPCAPTEIQPADFRDDLGESLEMYNSGPGTEIYTWFDKTPSGEVIIPDVTIDYLRGYVLEHGPIEGIIGFSQGAAFAGYLASNFNHLLKLTEPKDQSDIKWFINYSGFKVLTEKYHKDSYDTNSDGIAIPSLHVIGELDSVVEESRVMTLYDVCDPKERTLLKHPGGHFIPNNKVFVTKVSNWLSHATNPDAKLKDLNNSTKTADSDNKTNTPILDADLMDIIGKMGTI